MVQNFGEVNLSERVGLYLKNKLSNKGIREDFLCELGIDERTLRRWIQNGVSKLYVIEDIAFFFGESVRDILFGEDNDVPHHFSKAQKRTINALTLSFYFVYTYISLKNKLRN